jgi:signal transduction histidine kinase
LNATIRQAGVTITLAAAWVAFAAWQYHEFSHQREREQASLIRQSDVLRQALLGGVRTRRRLGRMFEEQMQAVLNEITATPGVIAVRIEDEDQWVSLSAGRTDSLSPSEASPLWLPQGLQTSERSELRLMPAGQGLGGGGPAWLRDMAADENPLRLRLTLLLDRTATDLAIRSAAQLRITVAVAGAAVLAAIGLAWIAGMRAIRAQAQTQLLQAEKERLEELSQAASGLAHETRNPLGVIRGGLQKLLRHGDVTQAPNEGPKLKLLVEECDRVTSRINQFLAYARPQPAEMGAVSIQPLVEELHTLLQPDLEAKQIRLRLRAEDNGDAISADANLLRQVLFNLLQNAIAFSPPGEAVEIEVLRRPANVMAIRVADRGPGVPQHEAPRLFAPYFTTRADGAGLGLAIVKRLAKQQGWSVRYEDRPGGGSLFMIEGVRVAANSQNPDR